MNHPLIPVLRWWLIQCVAIACIALWPDAGILLLFANCWGWWPGDGCCGGFCSARCGSTAPASYQIVLTGVANGAGGCDTCNGTFAMDFLSDTGACTWGGSVRCLYAHYQLQILGSSDATLTITPPDIWTYDFSAATPIDCTAPFPLTLLPLSTTDGVCDYTSAGLTVSVL